MVGLSLNPAYGLDPEMVIKEFLKSMRFDAKALSLTDEKKQEMAQRPPPEDPRVTAAKIISKSRDDSTIASAQIKKMELTEKFKDADLDRELAKETLSSEERRHLEEMKVKLADTALKLKTQTDLTIGAHAVDMHKQRNPSPQVASPAVEPVGRANPGQAFTQ